MQNRYVGDVGDYGKYGLLRQLADGFRLGVAWYMVPDEGHNNDGRHVGYLSSEQAPDFRPCDPPLYDALAQIVQANNRNVQAVEQANILPAGTAYHHEPLAFAGVPTGERPALRANWLAQAIETVAGCSLVFVDPDNGLQCQTGRHTPTGPKHVYWSDLQALLNPDRSLVIYHHLGRVGGGHPTQTATAKRVTGEQLNRPIEALRFGRGSGRVYLIAMAEQHTTEIRCRLDRMMAEPWAEHFTRS